MKLGGLMACGSCFDNLELVPILNKKVCRGCLRGCCVCILLDLVVKVCLGEGDQTLEDLSMGLVYRLVAKGHVWVLSRYETGHVTDFVAKATKRSINNIECYQSRLFL